MEKLNKKMKYALVIGASFIVLTAPKKEYEYHPDYEILNDNDAYAKYPKGYVYIGSEDYINNIKVEANDVLVVDERLEKSNMKIINSYKINDKEYQNDIINIILDYEKENPTSWDRSLETMRYEWYIHNVLYNLYIRRSSTTDVDFENNEEKVYKLLMK